MYARYMKPHSSTGTPWNVGAADVSAHRILSDLSAFIGHETPLKHRILAAGDLNIIYGATGGALSLPKRDQAVWDRVAALGLEFLGPQLPNGRPAASSQPDVPADTKNVPTYYSPQQGSPAKADRQLDYVVALARVPRKDQRAGAERARGVGFERPLPASDRGRPRLRAEIRRHLPRYERKVRCGAG